MISREEIAVAKRVVGEVESMAAQRDDARDELQRARDEIASLKTKMKEGTVFAGQRTWTTAEIEALRSAWASRMLLLEEVLDAFDFIDEYVGNLRPTARRAVLAIRDKVRAEVGR